MVAKLVKSNDHLMLVLQCLAAEAELKGMTVTVKVEQATPVTSIEEECNKTTDMEAKVEQIDEKEHETLQMMDQWRLKQRFARWTDGRLSPRLKSKAFTWSVIQLPAAR